MSDPIDDCIWKSHLPKLSLFYGLSNRVEELGSNHMYLVSHQELVKTEVTSNNC